MTAGPSGSGPGALARLLGIRPVSMGDGRARFELMDYRQLAGSFDRIVSVGMFEHVGVGHYREFFTKVKGLLADDGIAVLHSINRSDGPGATRGRRGSRPSWPRRR